MSEDVTLTVEEFESLYVNYYLSLISFTILVYEYCLTFGYEVERFWRMGRLNWASGLFYANRYLALMGHIPVMFEYFWSSKTSSKLQMLANLFVDIFPFIDANHSPPFSSRCHNLQSYHQYFAVLIQIIVSSMLIMRMYALYNQDKRVLAVHIGFALLAVVIGCWAIIGGSKKKPPEALLPVGCGATLTHEKAKRLGGAWCGMLVFDVLVFGMTVYKSFSTPRTRGISLITILLRDGAIYFSIMIFTNIANILTFFYGGLYIRGVATTLTNIISSVMISRLMLNLRHPSLVSHSSSTFAWDVRREDGTFPNLTFVEPYYDDTQDNETDPDLEFSLPPQEGGRARTMYEYLARGSSAPHRVPEDTL